MLVEGLLIHHREVRGQRPPLPHSVARLTPSSLTGVSWAAAIMKAPVESVPQSYLLEGTAGFVNEASKRECPPIHVLCEQKEEASHGEVNMPMKEGALPDGGGSFADTTAWTQDSSGVGEVQSTPALATPPSPVSSYEKNAPAYVSISFGAFDQEPAAVHTKVAHTHDGIPSMLLTHVTPPAMHC